MLYQNVGNIAVKDLSPDWAFGKAMDQFGITDKKVCVNLQHAFEKALVRLQDALNKPNMTYPQVPSYIKLWVLGIKSLQYFYYDPDTGTRHKMFRRGKCGCFAEGTMITMADGSKRPIQTLQAGDRV